METLEIRPGWGLTHLPFGATLDEAGATFGDPDRQLTEDDEDDLVSVVWSWDEPPVELRFEEEAGFRLTSFTTASPEATLFGRRIIGGPAQDAIDFLATIGLVDPWGTDLQRGTALIYEDHAIILWVREDRVQAVQWGVKTDDEGVFCWPPSAEA